METPQRTLGVLGNALSRRFGRERLLLDISTIEPGADFTQHIRHAVESCDVMLVIIGPRWVDRDYDGRSRLENPDDFIRMEIASALQSRKRLIPVLVGGAGMPRADELAGVGAANPLPSHRTKGYRLGERFGTSFSGTRDGRSTREP